MGPLSTLLLGEFGSLPSLDEGRDLVSLIRAKAQQSTLLKSP